MDYLFFDCETTGLPHSRNQSVHDVGGWPRLVQLGWAVYDSSRIVRESHSFIVRPSGFSIPVEASRIHGITHAEAVSAGDDVEKVLARFTAATHRGRITLVAHNLDFDRGVVGAELVRLRLLGSFLCLPAVCTMKTTTDLCRIPKQHGSGYKWPKLQELHEHLFGEEYRDAHDAVADLEACARCFFELRRSGHIQGYQ